MVLGGKHVAWCGASRALILFLFMAQSAMAGTDSIGNPRDNVPVMGEMSGTVQMIASWAVSSGDNQDLPFLVVDKIAAKAFLFDPQGALEASTAVLLGLARGDHSVPGIGARQIADIRPGERTTPAGRFVGRPGKNIDGEDVIWFDYNAALSIHRVHPGPSSERRLERLATATPADNRISYGCVVVPVRFYEKVIAPAFARKGIVYVLPETRSAEATFDLGGTKAVNHSDDRLLQIQFRRDTAQ